MASQQQTLQISRRRQTNIKSFHKQGFWPNLELEVMLWIGLSRYFLRNLVVQN